MITVSNIIQSNRYMMRELIYHSIWSQIDNQVVKFEVCDTWFCVWDDMWEQIQK